MSCNSGHQYSIYAICTSNKLKRVTDVACLNTKHGLPLQKNLQKMDLEGTIKQGSKMLSTQDQDELKSRRELRVKHQHN